MKKRSYFISNQDGFVLPYVLFIIALVLLLVIPAISSYSQEIEMTQKQMEQLQIESLFQMGWASLNQEDLSTMKLNDTREYAFPDGTVTIECTLATKSKAGFNIYIKTSRNSYYEASKIIYLDS